MGQQGRWASIGEGDFVSASGSCGCSLPGPGVCKAKGENVADKVYRFMV